MNPFLAALLLIIGGAILIAIASRISFSMEKSIKKDKDLHYEEKYNAYGKRYKILAGNPYSKNKSKSNMKIIAAESANAILFILYLFGMMMVVGGIMGFVASL